jgi:glutathione S-transferase
LFAVTELEQPLWRIAKNKNLYPQEQRLAADIPLASEDFRRMADVAEKHMQGRNFVVGDDVTVADFVLAYTLDWANEVKLLDRCPQLVAYMERMYARPKAPKRIAQLRAALSGS